MRVYEFEWGHHSDERFLMEINATARVVEELLDEYRHTDPDGYNNEGFAQFELLEDDMPKSLIFDRSIIATALKTKSILITADKNLFAVAKGYLKIIHLKGY